MLEFLQLRYTKCKDLFKSECKYYVYINGSDEVEVTVKKPTLTEPAISWKRDNMIFSGSNQELCEFLESLKPTNKVVPIR